MEFKDKLKQLRKQMNLTQDALGHEIHVSRSTIAKWEAGLGLPQKDSLLELSRFFNVTEDELIASTFKEETLIIKNKKIHRLNSRIITLSVGFVVILVCAIIATSIIVKNNYDLNRMADIHTSIQLANYKNYQSKEVAFSGEIDRKETLLKHEFGYSYQKIEFEKVKYTDKSSLVLIKVSDQFVPGRIAYESGDSFFKKDATLDVSYTQISFNDEANLIYSWPNLKAEWVPIHSINSENIIYDSTMPFSRIHLQYLDNQLQFYYQERFDDVLLSKDKKEIIRDFTHEAKEQGTLWKYQMFNSAKHTTMDMYSYYLIEVNDAENSSFGFTLVTGMSNSNHEIKRKQFITCYL